MTSDHGSDIHFFKRIEEYTLRNGELRIPRSFVNKYWEEISNPISLLLPNRAKWEVNWKKIDAEVWLIDKWKKFAESFCLDEEHVLVFRYVGKSEFKVVILDQSGLEIVYPSMEGSLEGADNGNRFGQRKRGKFPLPSSASKKVKINPRKEPNSYPTQDVVGLKKFSGDNVGKTGRSKMRCSRSKVKTIRKKELSEDTENGTALERANSFHSENPFFIREMHRSYIFSHFLFMPANFITEDPRKGNNRVSLWISEEESWDMNFSLSRDHRRMMLGCGWTNFVKDNNLKIGNVCVFERIKKPGISFRVIIFRDTQESGPSNFSANGSKQTPLQNTSAVGGSDRIPNKHPSNNNVFYDSKFRRCDSEISGNQFALLVKTSDVCIPEQFIRNHNMRNAAKVRLKFGNGTFPVRLEHDPRQKYYKLSYGWSNFMAGCKLNEGDVCNFELVDKDMFMFQVRVARCID